MKTNACFLLFIISSLINNVFSNDYIFSKLSIECKTINSFTLDFEVPTEYNTLSYIILISYDGIIWNNLDTIYANQSQSLPSKYIIEYENFDSLPKYIQVQIINFDWQINYHETISSSCNLEEDNNAYYTIINNRVYIKSHVMFDMDVIFSIYDLKMNLLKESHLHFYKGENNVVIDYFIEEYKSYIFICQNNYMMRCSRLITYSN